MLDIIGVGLKSYVASSRSCNITGKGCIIAPVSGQLKLNFNQINAQKITLMLKRVPGSDGEVLINGKKHTIALNKVDEVNIGGGEVSLLREKTSVGNILVVGVKVDNVVQNPVVKMTDDWYTFLKLTKSMKGIQPTDYGLFASEGAEIQGTSFISKIETDPPEAFVKKEDSIKFVYSCRIINIEKDSDPIVESFVHKPYVNSLVEKIETSTLINRHPEQLTTPIVKDIQKINSVQSIPVKPRERDALSDKLVNILEINSMNADSLSKKSHVVQYNNSVSVGRLGSFEIPVSNLRPHTTFVVIVSVSKLNGNGRMSVSLETDNGAVRSKQSIIAPSSDTKMYVTLNSARAPEFGSNYVIKISRPPNSSTGDIVVSGIRVASVVQHEIVEIAQPQEIQYKALPTDLNFRNNVKSWYDYSSTFLNQNIKHLSEYFSVLDDDNYQGNDPINANGTFVLTDTHSRVWYNRMAPNLKSSSFHFKGKAFHEKLSAPHGKLSITSINFFKPNEKVWIKEIDDTRILNQEDAVHLSGCKIIFTPSKIDMFKIKEVVPSANVYVKHLPWLYVSGNYTRQNYSVYYEINEESTVQLLNAWNSSFGKLYIIGSTLALPEFAEHVSQYMSYPDLVKLVVEARDLIYLSNSFDHKSGLIELALSHNVNLISNNHEYLNKGLLIRNNKGGVVLSQDILRALGKRKDSRNIEFNLEKYNHLVNDSISALLDM